MQTPASSEFLPGGWMLVEKIADTSRGASLRLQRGEDNEKARARILSAAAAKIGPDDFGRRLAHVQAAFAGVADASIVRLVDGGVAHGTPFAIYANLEPEPKPLREFVKALPVDERLSLYFAICRAVRHAHGLLLTHGGDLAASIGIDQDGKPLIDEFGLAYLTGEEAAFSTKADIVSLGASVLPAIFEGRKLPGDLRDIATKAEQGRYESVEQLALDVERYGKGFPVHARTLTPFYRVWKYVWRNKTFVLGAAGASLVLLLFLWFSVVSIRERYRQEAALNELRGTAGLMAVQMPQHIANLPQSLELRRKMIAQGVAYLDEHLPELNPEDRVQRRIFAMGQYETANAMAALGDFDQALTRYRSAQDLFWQDNASLLPDPQVAVAMGETLVRRANLLLLLRKSAEASQAAEQCLSLAPGIRGNDGVARIALTCRALRVRALLEQGRGISAGELAALEQSELQLERDKTASGVRMDARYALAEAQYHQNNYAGALEQARIGLDLVAGINKGLGASIEKARLMFVAGLAETALGGEDRERAANRFSECIDILREVMRRDPRGLETRELLAKALIEYAAYANNPDEPLLARGPLMEADTLAKGLLSESGYPPAHMLRVRALGKLGELLNDCAMRKQALEEFGKVTVKLRGEELIGAAVRTAAKACP